MSHPHAAQLATLMAQANIDNVVLLAKYADVAARQLYRLQEGLIHTLPVATIVKLAQYFDQSVDEFLAQFLPTALQPLNFGIQTQSKPSANPAELETLKAECDRLILQLTDQTAAYAKDTASLKAEKTQLEMQLADQAVTHAAEVEALKAEYAHLETQLAEQAVTHATEIEALDHRNHDPAAIDPATLETLQAQCDRLQRELEEQALGNNFKIQDLEAECEYLQAKMAEQTTVHITEIETLKAEYQRLEEQLTNEGDRARQAWQQEALDILESWLLQWSAAASAAQDNPQFPAKTLVTLAKPFDQLLASWNVTPIGSIGEEVAYDPKQHQLVKGGFDVQSGEPVIVQNVGYQQGDRLLHRAKVISQ